MFRVNEIDKKICEMVIGMIKKIEIFNNEKIDIKADEEFPKFRLSSEKIEDMINGKSSSSITIKYYKVLNQKTISLNLNNPGSNYEHNIEIYKNEEPELFKDFVDAMKYLHELKNENSIENAKVVIDNIFNNL